jgi:hypothetical protein
MFLRDQDYNKQIKEDILDVVIRKDPSIKRDAELAAQAEVESYLRHKYDTAAIFTIPTNTPEPTEENPEPEPVPDYSGRNHQLVMYMVDIALYHLHCAINPRNIDIRVKRYDDAIAWLKMVQSGKISADLPLLEVQQNPFHLLWGSEPKANNYY